MKIGVCLKQVPATDTRIKINAEGTGIVTDEVKWEVNPYDEFALEAALLLKEAGKASEVVILTVGGADCEQRIKDGLARGADSAIRMDDASFAGSDALGIARILAAAATKAEVGLVLCGKQAIDGDSSQVPGMMAELLNWAQVTDISSLELEGDTVTTHRAAGAGNKAVIETTLPVVLSCDKGLNTPRFASLRGIMMAKRKKIEVWGGADLGLDGAQVGSGAAVLAEQGMSQPPARPAGRMIDGGSVGEKVNELVRLLREEAKVL